MVQPESLRAHSAGCAGQMLGSRTASMQQLRAALQATAARGAAAGSYSGNTDVAAAAAAGDAAAGCWYVGPADASTCESSLSQSILHVTSTESMESAAGKETDASASSPSLTTDEDEAAAEDACRNRPQQQQQQGLSQATALPRWSKQDLQQLRRTSFNIPVSDLGSYSAAAGASTAHAAAAEAAAAAAAAAVAAYRMPSPGFISAGNSGPLLRRRYGSAMDLQSLAGQLGSVNLINSTSDSSSSRSVRHSSGRSTRHGSVIGLINSGPLPLPASQQQQQQQQQQLVTGVRRRASWG
jgi:hypothetical protein